MKTVTSPLLDMPGLRHAFFTRRGGVSGDIYASLNVGPGSSDAAAAVAENRRRCAAHFGAETVVTAYQVHSADAAVVEGPWPGDPPQADAVVTAAIGVVCGALSADCAPILLADPKARVVAAVHAGWKGALTGVGEAAIAKMETLGAERGRLVAVVGPCIGPASYEVGPEFRDRFTGADGSYAGFFTAAADAGKQMFDLPAFVLARLRKAGVKTCDWVGHDTCAEESLFFSNRRAFKAGEPDYGRLLSAIMLEP